MEQKHFHGRFGRTLRRGAIGAVTGGTAALLAAGAMAATGDPSKALSMAAAAGTAGASFGNFYGDKFAKAGGDLMKGGTSAFWGSQSRALNQYKYDKAFLENPDTIDGLTKALGSRDKALEAIRDGSVQAFLNNNITDTAKIGKALKIRNKYMDKEVMGDNALSDNQALERAVALTKWSRDVNPGIFAPNSNEQARWKQNLRNRGAREDDINEILNKMEEIYTA